MKCSYGAGFRRFDIETDRFTYDVTLKLAT